MKQRQEALVTETSTIPSLTSALHSSHSAAFVSVSVRSSYLPGDDGDFGDGGLGVGVQQFGSMSDDAAILLGGTC